MWRLFNTVALSPKRGAAATVFAATEAEALDHPYWGPVGHWRHGVGPVEPTSASVLNASTTLRRCGPGRRSDGRVVSSLTEASTPATLEHGHEFVMRRVGHKNGSMSGTRAA